MNHRATVAGAVTAVALLATLTACSGDSDSDDPIKGTQSGDPATLDPSTTPERENANPGDGIDRPEIVLPDDLEVVVEEVVTDDPVEQAILYDNEQIIMSKYAALAAQDTQHPALSFYYEGSAQGLTIDVLVGIIDENLVSAGTARYFNRQVDVLGEESAIVKYCRDFSGVYEVDADSGDVINEAEPNVAATLYTERVKINDLGVWHSVEYETEAEASECK